MIIKKSIQQTNELIEKKIALVESKIYDKMTKKHKKIFKGIKKQEDMNEEEQLKTQLSLAAISNLSK
jgi:hypothetical protein